MLVYSMFLFYGDMNKIGICAQFCAGVAEQADARDLKSREG